MRWGTCIIVLAAISGGCAAQSKQPQAAATKPSLAAPVVHYQKASNASLAFDPPVTIGQPPLQLSREGRSPEAFVGYDSLTATYFVQHSDDHQLDTSHSRFGTFERRAVSTKVGVSYR